jgi:hypothetical protein
VTRGGLILAALAVLLTPVGADAHLFHFAGLALRETQVARDFRLIKELIEWKDKHFDFASKVYRGEIRPRPSNPAEPGFLLKARYQRTFPTPPLKVLAVEVDRQYGTAVDPWIEARLAARNEEGVKAGFRVLFYFQIRQLLDALAKHRDRPAVARQLFGVLTDYLFTAFEVHLALSDRPTYLRVKDTLEHLRAAAGLTDPPTPRLNEIGRLRTKLLRLLAKSLDRRVAKVVPS